MIAALATLVFLATLWLLVVVGAAILEESGARIAAGLKGAVRDCRAATRGLRAFPGSSAFQAAGARAPALARRRLTPA